MFEHAFVNGPQQARKPAAVALSIAGQAAALVILDALPLICIPNAPVARFRNLIMAQPQQPPPTKHTTTPAQMKRAFHVFVAPGLITAARTVEMRQDSNVPAAPDIGLPAIVPAGSGLGINDVIAGIAGAAPRPPALRQRKTGPVRIGGSLAAANLIRAVQPGYPQLAKSMRVEGTVEFTATISEEGEIRNLTLVRGHPLLVAAAREAVLQWKYRPTLLNGKPVEAVTEITVNFRLSR